MTQVFMFSDYVNAWRALVHLPLGAYAPLLMFSLVIYFVGKLFRTFVLRGPVMILTLAMLACLAVLRDMMQDGQHVLAMICAVPLLFIGREYYRRLTEGV